MLNTLLWLCAVLCTGLGLNVNVGQLRDDVKEMFDFSYSGYMENAFPLDELRPISCTGVDTLGGFKLTLIDSLDMLLIVGEKNEFCKQIDWLGENLSFEIDKNISVFEVTIRVLGGLISSHLLIEQNIVNCDSYDGSLLTKAYDLGQRLLPAFSTPTGIPYGTVNLLHGVPRNETTITSLAGGGTNLIEFTVLSILTHDKRFSLAASTAAKAFYDYRSPLNLLGSHINITTGLWTHQEAGIGGNTDSYYEYLIKSYALFGSEGCLEMFWGTWMGISRFVYSPPWWTEVNMHSGEVIWPILNSLTGFYEGVLFNSGSYKVAVDALEATHAVWRKYGALPEGFSFGANKAHPRQSAYPLRPELAESVWQLYRATRDPKYLEMGADLVFSIKKRMKGRCGYFVLEDVTTGEPRDAMESFFLSETLKYLYLLFDSENFINTGKWVFNTEGHPFPLSFEFVGALSDLDEACRNDMSKSEPMTQCPRFTEWDRFTVDNYG
eukprot:TRINITY_DN7276_c1_g1_i1.p1 TRINITY_DN7276_c1_g1~~TRINITY_DN7276_c1_g1_i1.p1  ORF type:complete len:525 (+),score=56.06 TRINITY_DN7276_c1_g1_i1:95-1576(+)